MIEMLVVLAIVGILMVAYVAYRADDKSPAVRGTMNTLYATLVDARSMARGSGQAVTLTPSGTASKAVLTYQTAVATGPSGQYVHAADPTAARFCIVDLDGSTTAGSAAISSLQGSLVNAKANVTNIFGPTAWTQSLFDASKFFQFNSNGAASTDAFAVIVGASNGEPVDDGPVGIILVNASGNIYRYYRASGSSTWVRL
jgi:Tfp pilus assembly protein FimT